MMLYSLLAVLLAVATMAQGQQVISIRSFSGDRCSGVATQSYSTFSGGCTKLAPLAFKSERCENGVYKTRLCTDSRCQFCINKDVNPNECLVDENANIACSNLNAITPPAGATAKLSFYSSGDSMTCNDGDVFNIIFAIGENCHKIEEELYFKLKINGNQATANFFQDSLCRRAMDFSRQATMQNNQCFLPEFIPMPNIAAKLNIL